MRKLLISFAFGLMFILIPNLHAQEFDAALGFGTSTAPAGENGFPSLSGGLYISFNGNFRLKRHFGFGGEVASRASQAPYGINNSFFSGAIPYRPIFFDFNAIYGATSVKKKIGGDVMAGIGGENLRFYSGNYNCNYFGCTNYSSSTHFAWHFGADFRYYVYGHAFIRPEAHYYIVHDNWEFNHVNVARYAVSIGYSFMPGF